MKSLRSRWVAVARRGAFTLIEMLVVISIIMILAGMILPAVGEGRRRANEAKCMSNLHQIGVALTMYSQTYGEGRVSAFPPWLTLLTQSGGRKKYLDDPRVLLCPDDASKGIEGGRPDHMRYDGNGQVIEQFEGADIDAHTGPLDGSCTRKNSETGGVNSSYIFEYNGEPCDWIYNSSPPIGSGTSASVPSTYEWQWGTPPDWATFLGLADSNKDGVLSWNEVKVLCREGASEYGLPARDIRVPIVRCYWHVDGQSILRDSSCVLDLLGDASAVHRGQPPWFKD